PGILIMHPVEKLSGACIPVHFVGIRNEHGDDRSSVKAIKSSKSGVVHKRIELVFIKAHLLSKSFGKFLLETDVVEGKFDRILFSSFKFFYYLHIGRLRLDDVSPRLNVLIVAEK